MATIKEIAKLSGYSIGTVSRVINNNPHVSPIARREISKIIEELAFEPNSNARVLKQKTNKQILVIVKGRENHYLEGLVEKIENELQNYDKEMSVTYVNESDDEVAHAIKLNDRQRPEGIIFLGIDPNNFNEDFKKIEIPCVILTNMAIGIDHHNVSSFSTNDLEASKCAANYLIENGHHNIAIIGGTKVHDETCIESYRLQGVIEAMNEHGLAFDINRQFVGGPFSYEGGYNALVELLKLYPEVTAVFAMADIIAIGAIRACNDLNKKVPEDISIVGFDGIKQCEYCVPRLTTISQNNHEFARRGVKDLIDRIENSEKTSVSDIVPFALIQRASVRKI